MISILIVDDEKLIRETMVNYIKWPMLGIDAVYEAADGRYALNLVSEYHPDIIVADIKMPHMNGIELAQIVREQFPDIRFVFLSGHSDKEYLKKAIHLHVDEYIEKPLNLEEISMHLQKLAADCLSQKGLDNQNLYFYRGNTASGQLNQEIFTLSNSTLQQMEKALKSSDPHTALLEIKKLCKSIRKCEGTPPEYVRNVYFQFALQVQSAAELHCAHDTLTESSRFANETASAPCLEYLEKELLRIVDLLFAESSSRDLDPVKLVNAYVEKNFADSTLTIEQIAQHLHFNTSYLCTVYKKRTNHTINRFLTTVRIEAACKYLKNSDMKLYEIGSHVGYPNGKYFTKIFINEIGLSPKEYRRLHHE